MQIENKDYKKLDLTIVIPTFERQFLIKNLIELYKDKPYEVLILDGSRKSMNFIFPSNINYIWSGKSYLERLTSASKYIQTNYVCMIGDDEFLFSDALIRSLEFLESNKKYISCSGFPVTHRVSSSIILKEIMGVDSFFCSRLKKHFYGFENNCYSNFNISRLKEHFSTYKTRFFYSVTRTKIWNAAINSITIAISQGFEASCLYELMIEYSIIGAGPVHLIDMPMQYRSNLIINSVNAETHDLGLEPSPPSFGVVWSDFPQTKKIKLVNQLKREISSVDYRFLVESFDIYSKQVFNLRNPPKNKNYIKKIFQGFLNKFNFLKHLCFTVLILICFRFNKKFAIFLLVSGLKISINSKLELKKYLNSITKIYNFYNLYV